MIGLFFTFPDFHNFVAYDHEVAQTYKNKKCNAQAESREHRAVFHVGEEGFDDIHIIVADKEKHEKRNEQHGNVQADSQQLLGAGHLRGLITNEQEIFKFARVLLHKQIDA